MTTPPALLTVRRAREDEWRETRALRLAALQDPAGPPPREAGPDTPR